MSTSTSSTTSSSNNSSCGSPTLLSDEELRKLTKPVISHDLICSAASASYGPATVIQQLDSYDDCNFLVEIIKTRYLLKVHNGVESADYITSTGASKIGFANALYRHVRSNGLLTNEIVPVKYGADVAIPSSSTLLERSGQHNDSSPTRHFQVKEGDDVALCELPVLSPLYSPCILAMQLLTWVDGTTMSSARSLSIESVADAGVFLGKLRHILDTFPDPLPASAKRFHAWDTKNIVTLRKYTNWIEDELRQSLVHSVIDAFENELLPDSNNFPQGVIHGDFNDANILLDDCYNVAAVIDFGDSIFSWRILDLSVGMAYAMLSPFGKTNHSLAAAAAMLRGFHSVYSVTDKERRHLRILIACRLALSCTYGAFSLHQNPENHYLTLHAEPAWRALKLIWGDGGNAASINSLLDLACEIPTVHIESLVKGTETRTIVDCSNICYPDPSVNDIFFRLS